MLLYVIKISISIIIKPISTNNKPYYIVIIIIITNKCFCIMAYKCLLNVYTLFALWLINVYIGLSRVFHIFIDVKITILFSSLKIFN